MTEQEAYRDPNGFCNRKEIPLKPIKEISYFMEQNKMLHEGWDTVLKDLVESNNKLKALEASHKKLENDLEMATRDSVAYKSKLAVEYKAEMAKHEALIKDLEYKNKSLEDKIKQFELSKPVVTEEPKPAELARLTAITEPGMPVDNGQVVMTIPAPILNKEKEEDSSDDDSKYVGQPGSVAESLGVEGTKAMTALLVDMNLNRGGGEESSEDGDDDSSSDE